MSVQSSDATPAIFINRIFINQYHDFDEPSARPISAFCNVFVRRVRSERSKQRLTNNTMLLLTAHNKKTSMELFRRVQLLFFTLLNTPRISIFFENGVSVSLDIACLYHCAFFVLKLFLAPKKSFVYTYLISVWETRISNLDEYYYHAI